MQIDANIQERSETPREKKSPVLIIFIGWMAAVIALVFIPILFGAIAVIIGYVVKKSFKRDVAGFSLMVGGIAGAILGILIGIATNL